MKHDSSIAWGGVFYRAIVAGICGCIALDLFLWIGTVVPARSSMPRMWQYVASVLVGPTAFTSPSYAALGAATQLAISIGWAGGYAYFAATRPATNRHWLVAGASYGIVVYALMQLILLAGGHFQGPPTPNAFVIAVVAHVVFFGIPVAYVVHRLQAA